ncbi:hypothetical protein GDO81_015779 [Engystomops pustulosus]|uniref:G-protein coupled receptors family 1 profile domain-containing protein n=1 Tax=Engystomops pustulosus TaxID=76066 RepID=A0AAV7ARS2_ENGPU|nr:hypothetical protein GDO81_015779 [Engystomops pustulosus]
MSGVNSSTVDNQLGNKCLATGEEQFQHYGQFTPSVSILLAVLMILMVLATVLGNALVILAFVVDKGLRTQGNFFFLNLAIADFLVGGFCIPLYIPYVLTGQWKFGKGLCKLWLVMDYLLCTASVFNIVLISYDRFISVTKAVINILDFTLLLKCRCLYYNIVTLYIYASIIVSYTVYPVYGFQKFCTGMWLSVMEP